MRLLFRVFVCLRVYLVVALCDDRFTKHPSSKSFEDDDRPVCFFAVDL
jgi:hypothetical protein